MSKFRIQLGGVSKCHLIENHASRSRSVSEREDFGGEVNPQLISPSGESCGYVRRAPVA